ncbi:MAG: Ig domain-containing protein, partial [Clostridia bacterium]
MKKLFCVVMAVVFAFQLIPMGDRTSVAVQAASNVNTPADFLIPGTVQTTGVEPLGANLGTISGANNFAINNEVDGSGFEPIVIRNLERVDHFGTNWFAWDGHGGMSMYAQKWTGYLNGAEVRFYRLVNPSGSPLPYSNGNIDVTNANNVSYIGKASIPTPCTQFPNGGFISNMYTNPGNVGHVKYNTRYTDKTNMTNGRTFYYVVKAVDAKGNQSVVSNEASVAPSASANTGPHIYGLTTTLQNAVAATQYNHQLTATGGTAPYTWTITQGTLPSTLSLNASTGEISGTPVTTPAETSLTIKVTDALGLFETRNYKLNPVADVVDNGDMTAPNAPTNLTATASNGAITLNWTASTSSDTVGYQVLVSDTPASQQMERAYLDTSSLNLQQGDYAFIYKKTNTMDPESVSMRMTRSNAGGDVFSYDKNTTTLTRVAHPGTIPPTFTEKGETCLEVDAKAGSIGLGQYKYFPFIPGNGESQWYSQLRPGAPYKVEVWMRQVGLADSGKVKFEFNGGDGAYSVANQVTPWNVTGTWQKFTYEFTGPAYPTSGWHISFGFKFTGPGKLYMDNFLMYRNDAVHNYKPFTPQQVGFDELMDSMPSSGKKPSIRFYGLSFNDSTMDAQTSNYASSNYNLGWAPSIGSASRMTIAQSMDWAYKTGNSSATRAVPYFTVPVDYYENEWKGLIEYLGVPYDPGTDTPESKPFAYKRYVQRGNNGTPWTSEFREIMIELGNETWHNGWMESWDGFGQANAVTAGGKEYGLFAKYIFNDVIGGMPAWTSNNLNSKIKFSLGAFYNWQTDSYGELATQQGGNVSYLGHANYVGPKWETGDTGESVFNDHGVQESLVGMVTGVKAQIDGTADTRDLLNSTAGTNYQLEAYEGGPSGYSIYGVSETSENYGKSEAMGLAALDTWLYSSYRGYKSQNYLGYGSGSMWSSHTMPEAGGFVPHAGWLALKMRNKYATGDNMLQTTEYSNPTYDRVGTDVPLTGVYAMKDDSNNYSVFVLNRKLAGVHDGTDFGTGFTPVTLRLPFVNPTSIKVYKLSHADGSPVDPAENNRTTQNVFITEKTINPSNYSQILNLNANTGAYAQGIEPGGVYLYVFSGGTQATVPPTPSPTPSPTPTPNPEPGNVLANGSFEEGLASWTNPSNIGSIINEGVKGYQSIRIDKSISNKMFKSNAFTLDQNTEYIMTYYSRGAADVRVSIRDGAINGFTNETAHWVMNKVYFNSGVNTNSWVSIYSAGGTGTADIDRISVYKAADFNAAVAEVNITENLGPNIMRNGNFETTRPDGVPVDWGDAATTGTAVGVGGSVGLRVRQAGGYVQQYPQTVIPAQYIGKTMRVSFKVKALVRQESGRP